MFILVSAVQGGDRIERLISFFSITGVNNSTLSSFFVSRPMLCRQGMQRNAYAPAGMPLLALNFSMQPHFDVV